MNDSYCTAAAPILSSTEDLELHDNFGIKTLILITVAFQNNMPIKMFYCFGMGRNSATIRSLQALAIIKLGILHTKFSTKLDLRSQRCIKLRSRCYGKLSAPWE